ncbi:MAG: sensor domain-containing diguanylate cyclase [Bacteroides sp.]|nr:sensor domain-containing diguanylate cyclase [Bacteroides sp.]MCM1550889.1 sensor domain-containing diguanylate cyclase [Clostridium sp.]
MEDEKIMEHHQNLLKFHRILYGILAVFVFILYCLNLSSSSLIFLWVILGTALICVLETILSRFDFGNRLFILRVAAFVQYIFYLFMMYLAHDVDTSLTLGLGAMVLTFMFEFSYYNDITDDLKKFKCLIALILPAILCIALHFSIRGIEFSDFLLLIAYGMLCVVDILVVHLFYLNEHSLMKQLDLLLSELDTMEDNNAELRDFKNRIEKVNDELNLQRIQLGQMNKEIKQSNTELTAQADILKFVNRSFSMDMTEIMEYIIDVIIRVRRVEFCGIYIDKGVYYNKRPIAVCKCVSDPGMVNTSELNFLFRQASDREEDRIVIHAFPPEEYPQLSKTKVVSMLVLPLVLEDKKYGILVSGSRKSRVFDSYIAFYDVIVPQFDLAIHNIKMYAQMQHIAQTDGLTGINNRTHFNKLFAEQMEQTVKRKEPLTAALFDIDKFKRINDTYGHLAGDEVIKEIAHIAARHIEEPELGFICRYGGEEFVIVLPNMDIRQALPIIEALHRDIANTTVEAYGHVITMNVSIGVSSYPEICDDVNALIKRADWSMYYAKEHGRGQIKVDGPDITEG